MTKVAIIGAGSTVFTTELVTDILLTPGLEEGSFALVDIDSKRLDLAHRMTEWLIGQTGSGWTVEASTDRTRVLAGSDYVINTIEVAGLANVRHDFDIPMKYGVDQCIGDTIGPGGIFKALRTVPDWFAILHDVEALAPDAMVMNYTNPMSILTLTGLLASDLPVVGLCHSIQHTAQQLAEYLEVPFEELDFAAAGVNHLAWLTELSRSGEDLYPALFERARKQEIYEKDPVRFEMMFQLGYFVTESSGHSSEYVPYFRKRPELVQKFCRSEYLGETGFYANNWPAWRREGDEMLEKILAGEEVFELERGPEFASYIMEAVTHNRPAKIYGNVLNTGLVDNLPQNGVVEVACMVDRGGIQPTHFGYLPTQVAVLCQQYMAVHELMAVALLEEDREAAFHALAVDPLTAAVCSLEEIRQMFDEMVEAEKDYLPEFLYG
ncbi:MAG: alpha-galactosidase [Anaerolineales bacterium]|nr:alpha-galactosidase [Anaerolineales bacterium]